MNTGPAQFSEEVAKAVGNYVYRLIDPRNGETFYVGKGKGNRVFQHVRGLCCTNRVMAGVPLSPDRLIPQLL